MMHLLVSLRWIVCLALAALTLGQSLAASANAQIMNASDGVAGDLFGVSISLSGDRALVGASRDNDNGAGSGSAYYFIDLEERSGTLKESVKLITSDGTIGDLFGESVSLFGDSALVGAYIADENDFDSGAAYFFDSLDGSNKTVEESVKLSASDGMAGDFFGFSVSLFGNSAVVGAFGDDENGSNSGSAYYFSNLSTKNGVVKETAKLIASDGMIENFFGSSVSLSGDSALVGARLDDENGNNSGSAYYFANLEISSGTVTETVKLTAPDGTAGDFFGVSVSVFDDSALIGAFGDDDSGSISGSAYYFVNLKECSGSVSNATKLRASDGSRFDYFGNSVSLFGDSALVGAALDDDRGVNSGAAYFFSNLDSCNSEVFETVKLTASGGKAGGQFGSSVYLIEERISVGALTASGVEVESGSAYYTSVNSITSLDEGNVVRRHEAIDFQSRIDWIIGETTSNNSLTLSNEVTAEVDSKGRSIQIGAMMGADDNELVVEGTVEGRDLFIGSLDGNAGNQLVMTASGVLDVDNLHLAAGNRLLIEGDVSDFADLLSYLSSTMRPTDLFSDYGAGCWQLINESNAGIFLLADFDGDTGFTTVSINVDGFPLLGDVNLDGAVDLADIPAFVNLLVSGGFLREADINGDCTLDLEDIPLFVALLAS